MPIIKITQTPGLSPELKVEILKKLTEVYVDITGSSPASVWAIIEEVSKDDWSIGGESLSERASKKPA